jgi:hypothetical protein
MALIRICGSMPHGTHHNLGLDKTCKNSQCPTYNKKKKPKNQKPKEFLVVVPWKEASQRTFGFILCSQSCSRHYLL